MRLVSFVPNQRQKVAIDHVHGPMLVVAGAGTGKTTVLAQRVAKLIAEGQTKPDEIRCITYTITAAAELKRRVAAACGAAPEDIQASTIHAYCQGIVKRAGKGFRIVLKEDFWVYLRQNIEALGLEHFGRSEEHTSELQSPYVI